jgi:hypothetical protein
VIAQKLELSKAEHMVHNYIEHNAIAFDEKKAAATVIQNAWLKYKHTKYSKESTLKRFLVKRRLHFKVEAYVVYQ